MSKLILYIGDKNFSSWSLRPWLAMKQTGIAFSERIIPLDQPTTRTEILTKSPSGLVPCLADGEKNIWDSLAILEYLAETFPEKALWPSDQIARARARSVSAEMHAGFSELRKFWPMNFARKDMRHLCPASVRKDVDRIADIWTTCRREFGARGPFLFGEFTIADAMYAPVVSRFSTYGPLTLSKVASAYTETVLALPALKEWGAGAAAEVAARG